MVSKNARVGPGKMLLTIYIDVDLVKRIDRLSSSEDVSRSKYVERVLADSIEQEELTVRTMTDPVVAPAMMKALASPEVMRAMLSMIRQDLTDEQLSLFQQTMHAASEQVQKRAGRVNAKRSPSRGREKRK